MKSDVSSQARLLSVCVGEPKLVTAGDREVLTGIYKSPVAGPVMVRRLNLDGDRQADLTVHGGVDKAVYCYSSEHYPEWEQELSRPLVYGTFGENLTVSGLLETDARIDDVLAIGDAVLQVSQPRLPCYKLAIRMGDRRFLQRFLVSGRSGFYCRVLTEGYIEAGQRIELIERDPSSPTIASFLD